MGDQYSHSRAGRVDEAATQALPTVKSSTWSISEWFPLDKLKVETKTIATNQSSGN